MQRNRRAVECEPYIRDERDPKYVHCNLILKIACPVAVMILGVSNESVCSFLSCFLKFFEVHIVYSASFLSPPMSENTM
jgi:hypothetical protein